MNDRPPKRRRLLTFSLRSLFVLTAVSGMLLGLFALKLQRARQQRAAVEAILESQGYVAYGAELNDKGRAIAQGDQSGPKWLRQWLGNDFFDNVIEVRLHRDTQLEQVPNLPKVQAVYLGCSRHYSDAGLVHLQELPQLRRLRFGAASNVTDAGLVHVGACTQLESLEMPYLRITDEGLKHLKGLTQLESLTVGHEVTDEGLIHVRELVRLRLLKLFHCRVTDAGLEHLARHPSIEEIHFCRVDITNTGLHHLEGLPRLRRVKFYGTDVTREGIARLQLALPNCEILR
jgi:hypothetical protein